MPDSFRQPSGRGLAPKFGIRFMIRWRSFFREIASISLTAEGLIRSLYLATLFQIPDDVLKGKIGFVFAFVKRGKILSILGKT